MDIIIRTKAGQQYQLIRQDKPTRQPANTAYQSPNQLKSLLAGAEPLSPSSWPALWQKIRPANGVNPGDPNAIFDALQDLAGKQLLHIVPFEPNRKNMGPNRGAGGGSGGGGEAAALGALPSVKSAETVAPPTSEKAFSEDAATSSDAPATGNDSPVSECKTEGEPISMISGEELLQLTDCALPGPVPFAWTRTYRSSHARDTGLGCGWTHSASETLELDAQQVLYRDSDGRTIPFRLPKVHQRSRYIPEGLVLDRISDDAFILRQDGQPHRVFTRYGARSSRLRLTQLRHASYTPASNVLGVKQRESGYTINLHYNEFNQLTQLQGNWGKSLLLSRNGEGRITRVELKDAASGARKMLAEYDFNGAGDLIAQRNAKGVGEKYEYQNHLIKKRTLVTGFNFYFEWDGEDSSARCVHQWGDRGIYDYRFEWRPDEQRSKAIDSRGNAREYQYNQYGQIISELDCEGGLHQYAYERGRKRRYTDPEGNTTEYFFDRHNNPAGYRDALGNRVTMGWFNGKLTSITDKDKSHWRREYDSKGQLVALIDPFLQTTRYSYNADGLLASVTDPMQRTTRYQWSENAELLAITDPEGHQRRLTYDIWGQLASAEIVLADANSAGTIQFFYTPTGKVEKVVAPSGDTTHYTYNDNDQLTRHSDPQGRTTEFKYDGLSQVIERVDPEGQRLKYEYDSERNLTALINEKGEKYQFFYDGNERLIKEVGFDGRIQHYKYDKAGRLIKHLDAGDVMTEFERDALGQLLTRTSRSITNPAQPEEIARFNYDPKGRLLESYNAHQFVSFAYNAFGNITKEHHSDLNQQRQRISASMVDIGFSNIWPGKRSAIQLPDGQRIDYGFDHQNRLNQISLNGDIITRIERDFLGRETSRAQGDLITVAEYDPTGRLQKQTSYNQKQKIAGPIQREYGYDNFGNLNRLSDGPEESRYVYDLLNRLKKAEGNIPETFAFDPAGNLLQSGDADSSSSASVKGNRLYMQGDRKFTYDARGNLIQENRGKDGKLVTTFEYNLNNQLVKTTRDGQATTYTYDPLGRRISKTDAFGTTRYLWAGDQMVQEQRNNLKKTYIFEPETFKPVAQITDGKTYHYHLDHLGTPRELTDEQGKVVWKVRYKTYGNVAVKEVEEVENNLRFQGQYFDEETGLHYNRFRYYNPNTGQFITQDPIGLLGGVNNYQYAPNPVGWVDPFGLTAQKEDPSRATKTYEEATLQLEASKGTITTLEAYSKPGVAGKPWDIAAVKDNWLEERQQLHDEIVGNITAESMVKTKGQDFERAIYAMRGNTGAGKSRLRKSGQIPELMNTAIPVINPDDFKPTLIHIAQPISLTHNQVHWEAAMLSDRLKQNLLAEDGGSNAILVDKRLGSLRDVKELQVEAEVSNRKLHVFDVDAPLEMSLIGVLMRKPGGDDPIVPFDVISSGFQSARGNRESIIEHYEKNPDLGRYELYGTSASGNKELVAKVENGKLEIFEANNYVKLTEDSEEESSRLANTIITDEEIERVTAGIADPKFKANAVEVLSANKGKTWSKAVNDHGIA